MTGTQFEGSLEDVNVTKLISDYVPEKLKQLIKQRDLLIQDLKTLNIEIVNLTTHNQLIKINAQTKPDTILEVGITTSKI